MFKRLSQVLAASALATCLLSACVVVPSDKSASLGMDRSKGGQPVYEIALHVPGKWMFSGHAMAFGREGHMIIIRLPRAPQDVETFESREIEVSEADYPKAHPVVISAGQVIVDRKHGKVSLSLQNGNTPYWANGAYQLSSK